MFNFAGLGRGRGSCCPIVRLGVIMFGCISEPDGIVTAAGWMIGAPTGSNGLGREGIGLPSTSACLLNQYCRIGDIVNAEVVPAGGLELASRC